ncbi:MAG: hypothetical protein ACI4WG_00310 [Erysipelotrichaceae bacterium]
MKKSIEIVIFTILVMCLCPFILTRLTDQQNGEALMFILLLFINPLYCILLGIVSGLDWRNCLYYPLFPLIIFMASMYFIFDKYDKAFLVYGIIYMIITVSAMLVTMFIIKKKQDQLKMALGDNDEEK